MTQRQESGFTLIEIIAALVIMGILVAVMGKATSTGVGVFITTKENITVSQKAQVALMRLTRELKELTHIVAVGDSPWLIYDKINGRHAIARLESGIRLYDLPAGQITLSQDELRSSGHILVDGIERFILSYHAGDLTNQIIGTSTWRSDDDLRKLSGIGVRLEFVQPAENARGLSFNMMIHPRNTNSDGGEVSFSVPDDPARSEGSLVSSGASTRLDGRESQGRFYHASVILFILISPLFFVLRPTRVSVPTQRDESGSALLWAVIILTSLGVLAAALLPMTSAIQFGQVAGAFSDQAGLLAESGFRYAISKYLNSRTDAEKNSVLSELHRQNYQLIDNHGQFSFNIYPYFFYITEENSGNQLAVSLPGGLTDNLSNHLQSLAWVRIEDETYPCRFSWASEGTTGILSLDGTVPSFERGTTVLMVAKSADFSQSINAENRDLFFADDSGDAFPDMNAQIVIDGRPYLYHRNNRTENRLMGISDPGNPAEPSVFTIPPGSEILLYKYVDLETTGTVGSGTMQTERKITYHTPLPITSPIGERLEWHDALDNMDHWSTQWGNHQVENIDGDNALRVTRVSNQKGLGKASLITLDWTALPINFQNLRTASNGYLNYAAQVKIGFNATISRPAWGYDPEAPIPKYYAAGILFRLDNNQNCYGLSLMRGNRQQPVPFDAIDDSIVPEDNAQLLVLWQANRDGFQRQWLAYKRLDNFFDDMENGDSNWSAEVPWGIINNIYNLYTLPIPHPGSQLIHSLSHSLHNIQLGHYDPNTNISAQTRTIPIVCPCNVVLKFTHFYDIGAGDHAFVELSKDGGQSWDESPIHTLSAARSRRWEGVTLNLGAFTTPTDIKIRFRLQSDQAWEGDGWFIDDISIATLPIPLSTLAVQISEAATLYFSHGGPNEIETGSLIYSPHGRGRVIEPPLLFSSDWQGQEAAGILRLEMMSGEFVPGENLAGGTSTNIATVQNFRERENLIRTFYGSNTPCGNGDTDRFNLNRLANQRVTAHSSETELNWPPAPYEELTAEEDHFIQIQWDEINPAIAVEAGTVSMAGSSSGQQSNNTVIRSWDNELLIPSETEFDATNRPEIGLHSFGHGAQNIFFDDFGLFSRSNISTHGGVKPLME